MIELNELQDAAQKAFPADQLVPDRDESWKLVAEMGWLMIRVPEEAGGLGLGREASTAIHYELGRVLSSTPLITAQVALQAIAASETLADKDGWLERGCMGEFTTMSFAGGNLTLGDGDALNGTLRAVPDFDMAGHILVSLPGLVALVPVDAAGVSGEARELWDESRKMFDVTFANCKIDPSLVLARGDAATKLAAMLRGEMLLGLAADCLGGSRATLDMTVEYLGMRKQFERPLAMFQALKHRVADLQTQIVATQALMWSRAADDSAGDTDFGALKSLAADVYEFVTEESIQLHGGIGLTEEHQCHLFMKRAMLNLQLGGDVDVWFERAGRAALAAA
ncbi:MAG: acyl-CoA/acyl-ACP dehydrogenase [Novosphingobium sp.]|nr:acyl-CoA/acyl-ACP dehydrogenase [Novosphingobium sp.]